MGKLLFVVLFSILSTAAIADTSVEIDTSGPYFFISNQGDGSLTCEINDLYKPMHITVVSCKPHEGELLTATVFLKEDRYASKIVFETSSNIQNSMPEYMSMRFYQGDEDKWAPTVLTQKFKNQFFTPSDSPAREVLMSESGIKIILPR